MAALELASATVRFLVLKICSLPCAGCHLCPQPLPPAGACILSSLLETKATPLSVPMKANMSKLSPATVCPPLNGCSVSPDNSKAIKMILKKK
jgi:hypothetical protein